MTFNFPNCKMQVEFKTFLRKYFFQKGPLRGLVRFFYFLRPKGHG